MTAARRAWKRPTEVTPPTRRPWKRPAAIQAQERVPKAVLIVIQTVGEVRCPIRWSRMGMEACAGLQDRNPAGCLAQRCVFFGHGPLFLAEAMKCKAPTVAPKPVPRAKLERMANDFESASGDFSEGAGGLED